MFFSEQTKLLLDIVQTVAIILGGLYTVYEYRKFRRYRPKIQFDLDFDLHPIDSKSGKYLLNTKLIIKNLGQVRKKIPQIIVGVKTLGPEDIATAIDTRQRLLFRNELIPKHNIVLDPNDPWWVDQGVTQVFPCPFVIREPREFIQVNAKVYYYKREKEEGYHQVSLVKPVTT